MIWWFCTRIKRNFIKAEPVGQKGQTEQWHDKVYEFHFEHQKLVLFAEKPTNENSGTPVQEILIGNSRAGEDIKRESKATIIKWGNNPLPYLPPLLPHCFSHSGLAFKPSLLPFFLRTRKTANMCRSDISFPQIMELPACNNNLNFTPRCLCAEGSPEQWHKLASMHWADRWLPRPPPIDPR